MSIDGSDFLLFLIKPIMLSVLLSITLSFWVHNKKRAALIGGTSGSIIYWLPIYFTTISSKSYGDMFIALIVGNLIIVVIFSVIGFFASLGTLKLIDWVKIRFKKTH